MHLTEFLSFIFMITGLFFCTFGIIGMYKMPDLFSKQHALGLIDTVGYICICTGLAIYGGLNFTSLKVLLLGFISIFLSAPTCNALIKAALIAKIRPDVAPPKKDKDSKKHKGHKNDK